MNVSDYFMSNFCGAFIRCQFSFIGSQTKHQIFYEVVRTHIHSFLQVRDPMPAVYFFLIDVSMNAIQTGATAAACSAIQQVLSDLPVNFLALSNDRHVFIISFFKNG